MSDTSGLNYWSIIYVTIVIPILILSLARWYILRYRRQRADAQRMAVMTASNNGNNGLTSLDFVGGNPFFNPQLGNDPYTERNSAPPTNLGSQPYPAQQTTSVYTVEPPPPYHSLSNIPTTNVTDPAIPARENRTNRVTTDEPPSMIQQKRWF